MLCGYLAAGVAIMWAADSAAESLLANTRLNVTDNLKRLPRYVCVQTVARSQFELPRKGSSCANAISNNDRNGAARILHWHDRLRLDVAAGDKSEMYSWAGASKFEAGDVSSLVARGASGSGEFASFVTGVFGGDAEGFAYHGPKDMPFGSAAWFDFTVPVANSHYQYTADGNNYVKVGYRGSFYADPQSADLRELDLEATDFSASDSVCRIDYKIEYARTQIGTNSFMLPKSSSMDVVYRNATESLNETSFAGCREYVGEASIRFDGDANGNVPEAAKPADQRPLPPKTHLRVRIDPPVDSSKAAAGDPITGVVDTAIKEKGQTVVHVGDKLHGRIFRIEQTMGELPRWTVAIVFETLERNGTEQKISLTPDDDGDRSPSGITDGRGRISAQSNTPTLTLERPDGGGIYSFQEAGKLVLGQKFESLWETR